MTDTAARPAPWLRYGSQVVLAVIVGWLTVLNVSVLATSAVNDAGSEPGVGAWSLLLAALALAPVLVAFVVWRRGRRADLEMAAVVWSCVLSLLVLGAASLPFTLLVIAV